MHDIVEAEELQVDAGWLLPQILADHPILVSMKSVVRGHTFLSRVKHSSDLLQKRYLSDICTSRA